MRIMKRLFLYVSYVVIFSIAFLSSNAATFIWNDGYWSNGVGNGVACWDAGEAKTGPFGFTDYTFWDGTRLTSSTARFESVEAAQECFEFELQRAYEIIEREPLFDERHEQIVGERVVALFPPDGYVASDWAVVMCWDGDKLYEFTSTSLQRAVTFEKKDRKY